MDSFLYFCTLEEIKSNKEDNMAGLYEQIINQLFKAKLEKYDRKIYGDYIRQYPDILVSVN